MKKLFISVISGLILHLAPIQAEAYTLTPNYDFYLPGVNDPADANNWGTYLNANFSSIDSLLPGLSGTNTFTGVNTFSNLTKFTADIQVTDSINDSSNNELIKFGVIASAVNEITITNAATGNNPKIAASGDNTNIGFDFQAKGSGAYNFLATTSGPTEIRFLEDNDTGGNYTALRAASSIITNTVFELPAADGTIGQVIQTNGSGVLSFVSLPTPSTLVPAAVCSFNGSGTPAFIKNSGCTSITDNGVGNWDLVSSNINSNSIIQLSTMGINTAVTTSIFLGAVPGSGSVNIRAVNASGAFDSTYVTAVIYNLP